MIEILGSAVIAAIISGIISFYGSARGVYINSVTAERSKWIEKLRLNIATYTGTLRTLHNRMLADPKYRESDHFRDLISRINDLIPLIKLQLNPRGDIDKNIIYLIEKIPPIAENAEDKRVAQAESLLIGHSQWLLKTEWEKVKKEARIFPFSGLIYSRALLKEYKKWSQTNSVEDLDRE